MVVVGVVGVVEVVRLAEMRGRGWMGEGPRRRGVRGMESNGGGRERCILCSSWVGVDGVWMYVGIRGRGEIYTHK